MHKDVSSFFTGSASKLPDAQVNFDQIRRVVGIFHQIFHPFLLVFFKKKIHPPKLDEHPPANPSPRDWDLDSEVLCEKAENPEIEIQTLPAFQDAGAKKFGFTS